MRDALRAGIGRLTSIRGFYGFNRCRLACKLGTFRRYLNLACLSLDGPHDQHRLSEEELSLICRKRLERHWVSIAHANNFPGTSNIEVDQIIGEGTKNTISVDGLCKQITKIVA